MSWCLYPGLASWKASAIGPNANTGKKLNAPNTKITPAVTLVNNTVSVRKVPAVIGTGCLRDMPSASSNRARIGTYRPIRILTLALRFHHKLVGAGAESANPSKPEPLLAEAEAYSYTTWEMP